MHIKIAYAWVQKRCKQCINELSVKGKQFRDARAIAGQGGQQGRKGTEDHIQQIIIILFPNHVLLILLGTGFVLIKE